MGTKNVKIIRKGDKLSDKSKALLEFAKKKNAIIEKILDTPEKVKKFESKVEKALSQT